MRKELEERQKKKKMEKEEEERKKKDEGKDKDKDKDKEDKDKEDKDKGKDKDKEKEKDKDKEKEKEKEKVEEKKDEPEKIDEPRIFTLHKYPRSSPLLSSTTNAPDPQIDLRYPRPAVPPTTNIKAKPGAPAKQRLPLRSDRGSIIPPLPSFQSAPQLLSCS